MFISKELIKMSFTAFHLAARIENQKYSKHTIKDNWITTFDLQLKNNNVLITQ